MLNINDKGLNFQVMGMSPIKKIMQGGSIHSKRSTISSKVKQNGKKNIAIRRSEIK